MLYLCWLGFKILLLAYNHLKQKPALMEQAFVLNDYT